MLSQRDSVMFHLQQKRHGHVDCLVASGILLFKYRTLGAGINSIGTVGNGMQEGNEYSGKISM